jgi:hypothetical protein
MKRKEFKYKQRNLFPFLIIALIVALFSSCQEVLDKHDLNVLDDQIWEDEAQAALFINNLYVTNMPDAQSNFGGNSALSDEIWSADQTYTDLIYGFKTPSDINAVTVLHKEKYELIRRINIALEGLENSAMDEKVKEELQGQALFLRAWRYWEMIQLYGGISIVKSVQDPYTEDLNVPRSKTSEAINAIVADLDEAIAKLPIDWPMSEDKGRINSGAAAAFKGRVLLSWASPIFNPGNDQTRWQRAYDANLLSIDLLSKMNLPRGLYPDFSSIFNPDVVNNNEAVIYRRYSLSAGTSYTHGWEKSLRPPSGGGNGGYSPTWELVKAFPMANGKLIQETGSGYDSTYFWQNRDPRFYATVAFNGSEWNMTGRQEKNIWTFRNTKENNRVPSTGFYNKKATDSSIARENVSQTSTAWIELRYAEVLLNFAECANELGKTNEALENVRAIRARAGIESGGGEYGISKQVTKEHLREILMIERQVEFAFENKRYWDLRRRLMFREDLGQFVKKLNGKQRHGFTYTALSGWNSEITDQSSPYYGQLRIDTALAKGHLDLNDEASYSKYYRIVYKNMDIYNGQAIAINYQPFYDFFAVPSSMIEKSPAVEQTLGWINGTFDPLAE